MGIFARRDIARCLGDIRNIAPDGSVEDLVRRLDKAGRTGLSAEWEVVLLASAGKLFRVAYEPDLGGKSRLDLVLARKEQVTATVAADIAVVHAESLHRANPLNPFIRQFAERARAVGLSPNRFHFDFRGVETGSERTRKVTLKIPRTKKTRTDVIGQLEGFLSRCKDRPAEAHSSKVDSREIEFNIRYSPGTRYLGYHYPAYTSPIRLAGNPLHNSLKRKARQLSQSGYNKCAGILLCAADVDLESHHSGPRNVGAREIIRDFFRQYRSVAFVQTYSVIDYWNNIGESRMYTLLKSELFENPNAQVPLGDEDRELLKQIQDRLPRPVATGQNAISRLESAAKHTGASKAGGWRMTNTEITISSRELVDLLAGRIDQKDFLMSHSIGDQPVPIFERMLREGRLPIDVRFRRIDGCDDDLICFRFNGPDPAISKFGKIELP